MADVLVDSNIILDIITEDPVWSEWSARKLEELGESSVLLINPIIYAEVSVRYERIEELDTALPVGSFRREPLPWPAGFLAGKAFVQYRKNGGVRSAPLPDFYIGAHAAIRGATLLTRNARHFRKYFPRLNVISPDAEVQ